MEKQIEQYLKTGVEKLGGECLKFVTPGKDGAPDRIILWPRGRCEFVETKQPTGRLSPLQRAYHKQLRGLGFQVYVLRTRDQVTDYLEWNKRVRNEIYPA